ncbi:hypothetical protein EIN_480510 [Entamoeba invadens IP1]|uniref:Uncharacterized protein n=1 Tax=Entamoeba invadens IP1 TaxID=370355 RepID=L7FPF4_ENTIV|nr:hypothetical protein EIN_480510 [Entamoeba invadens IP1]ELP91152.1 hypothetical protein EIN_480510 [Entamoeba invadens IP1]|eukprot:XP_004257923.1 hypothetical protein EIN_480510 [Entamoeba invadens IP1]
MLSCSLILFACLTTLVYSEELFEPVCMNDFIAVDMNSSSVKIRSYHLCYGNIPDYTNTIKGYNVQSLCFVHPDYILVNKTTFFLNRCGGWLQLIGPSENVVNCMVAGYADIQTGDTSDVSNFEIERRTIGVYNSMYKLLTSGVDNVNNYLTQVTITEVAFDLGLSPSLYVLNRTDEMVTIQFTNHNKQPEKIGVEHNNVLNTYSKDKEDMFTFPLINDKVNIQMVAYDDEKIIFPDVNLFKEDIFTASVRFGPINTRPCRFIAETQIIDYQKPLENKLIYQKWQVWTINERIEGKLYDWGTNDVTIIAEGGNLTIIFSYANSFRIQKDFKELQFDFELNGEFEFIISDLLQDTSLTELDLTTLKSVQSNLPTKIFRPNNTNIIKMKVSFNPKTYLFSNVIAMTFKFSKNAKIHILSAYLMREEELKPADKCNSTSFDCLFTECSINNNSYYDGEPPFAKGCELLCGTCRDGFVCSTKGRCLREPSHNVREFDISISIVSLLMLIVMILKKGGILTQKTCKRC